MWIHYDNEAAALSHLTINGWTHCKSGNWVSKDCTCTASIHPITGRDQVCICYREINPIAA